MLSENIQTTHRESSGHSRPSSFPLLFPRSWPQAHTGPDAACQCRCARPASPRALWGSHAGPFDSRVEPFVHQNQRAARLPGIRGPGSGHRIFGPGIWRWIFQKSKTVSEPLIRNEAMWSGVYPFWHRHWVLNLDEFYSVLIIFINTGRNRLEYI